MSAACVIAGLLLLGLGFLLQLRQSFVHSLAVAPALSQVPLGRLALHFANGVALLAGVIALMVIVGGAFGLIAVLAAGGMSHRWLAAAAVGINLAMSGIVLRGVHHVQVGVRQEPGRIGRGLAWIGSGLTGTAALFGAAMVPDILRRVGDHGWGVDTTIGLGFAGTPLFVAMLAVAVRAAFGDAYRQLQLAMGDPASTSTARAESR